MSLRVGYACVNTRLPSAGRTVRLANATPERLRELVAANLEALAEILRWNAAHGVQVFRVSSETIPFGSHPVNRLAWWDEFAAELAAVGELVRIGGLRLSMHPGQYTVLGATGDELVANSLQEVEYHARLLSSLGVDRSHKIVIHVGGAYGDRPAALERFAAAYARLSDEARGRLVLENDERWSLEEVLAVGERLGAPVVFDVFHHEIRPSLTALGVREAVLRAGRTWSDGDGRQEVHFSTQAAGKRPGAHSETVDLDAFARFAAEVGDLPLDCVLEVKDKEISVLAARRLLARAAA